jgi:hypothetical protein
VCVYGEGCRAVAASVTLRAMMHVPSSPTLLRVLLAPCYSLPLPCLSLHTLPTCVLESNVLQPRAIISSSKNAGHKHVDEDRQLHHNGGNEGKTAGHVSFVLLLAALPAALLATFATRSRRDTLLATVNGFITLTHSNTDPHINTHTHMHTHSCCCCCCCCCCCVEPPYQQRQGTFCSVVHQRLALVHIVIHCQLPGLHQR